MENKIRILRIFIRCLILLVLGFLLLFTFSCKSKKLTSKERTTVQIDTVYQEKKMIDTVKITETRKVTQPIYYETEIPCDEDQKGEVKSGNNSIYYEIVEGNLRLKTKIDSCDQKNREIYKSQLRQDSINIRKDLEKQYSELDRQTVYVYPWWVWAVIVAGVISLGFNVYQNLNPLTKCLKKLLNRS